MQKVNRNMTKMEMLNVPFEHRAELFKKAVKRAAKRFMVDFTCDYIRPYHDYHVVIEDSVDEHNKVYYNTLTQEE